MGFFLARLLLRLIGCGTCALWFVTPLQTLHPGLVNLKASAIFADFPASACRGRSRLSISICRFRFIRQIGVLIPPPPRAPLGVFLHESICRLLLGFLGLGCQPSPPRLLSFQAVNCLSNRLQPIPGRQPVSSWWSLVLPE